LSVEWLGVEIHPDTPPEGRFLAELFPAADIDRMMQHLRITGAAFGITFVDRALLSNSRRALEAAEFAREEGKFDRFHPALFSAYFSLGLDIGNLDVLSQVGHDAGLDVDALRHAIRSGRYQPKLEEARQEAGLRGLTGVPTFFLGDTKTIVGAQPIEVFRKALRSL
jgi:predicted DsbA family dithiol-disulfide isomerase